MTATRPRLQACAACRRPILRRYGDPPPVTNPNGQPVCAACAGAGRLFAPPPRPKPRTIPIEEAIRRMVDYCRNRG